MPDIPPIRHKLPASTRRLNRGSKIAETETPSDNPAVIKRSIERRHKQDRRQKQIKVPIERRQRGLLRRKQDYSRIKAAKSDSLNDTVGKHINTTA